MSTGTGQQPQDGPSVRRMVAQAAAAAAVALGAVALHGAVLVIAVRNVL